MDASRRPQSMTDLYQHRSLLWITFAVIIAVGLSACDRNNPEAPEQKTRTAQTLDATPNITAAVNNPNRPESERQRDQYRHPLQTLSFFEIQPNHTVVEIWPGGGWYSAILAPLLKKQGTFIAASFAPGGPEYRQNIHEKYLNRLAENPDDFDQTEVLRFGAEGYFSLGADQSVDRVLTFRNTHNWIKAGIDSDIYKAAYLALKPGGIFGVVQHRSEAGADAQQRALTGYVPEDHIIATAIAAGFELVSRSDINANPADTKAYPAGVWTLPPSLRLKDKDREKYLAIGESDRMTLKFRKP